MINLIIIVFGLIIGSFLTVCIYRVPYGRDKGPGEFASGNDAEVIPRNERIADEVVNIFTPKRSFCPRCRKQLKWYHNIPFFSWFFLRGRCAYCKTRISIRYPLVELLSAVLCYLSFYMLPDIQTAALVYVFCCSLLVISAIDIEYYIIPNVISIPWIWLACFLVTLNHVVNYVSGQTFFSFPVEHSILAGFYGFLAGAGLLFIVAKLFLIIRHIEGLGFGDIKLLAMIGILFGPLAALYTIFLGSILGAVIGGTQQFCCRRKLSYPIPFGPYLALAFMIYVFYHNLPAEFLGSFFPQF